MFKKKIFIRATLRPLNSFVIPFICHLITYVPVLGAEQFQFPCRVIFAISAKTGSNWVLLILQTAEPSIRKESCCYDLQDFWVENFFGLGFDNVCLAEGHTEAAICVKWWLEKFDLKILKTVICLGFPTLKSFRTLAASGELLFFCQGGGSN